MKKIISLLLAAVMICTLFTGCCSQSPVTINTDYVKLAVLKKLPAGTMLHFPGHIMLYLGMKDHRPYVISAVGSFAPEDLKIGTVQSVNTVVINDLYTHRRSGVSWLESLSGAVVIK